MKNDSLIIMAGGASSRMKKSLSGMKLSDRVLMAAKTQHKSLIPLGETGGSLLYFLLENAIEASIQDVYIVTSPENSSFKDFARDYKKKEDSNSVKLHFAVQYVPKGRIKPLGTADALLQCLDQHPILLKERFTVCNGDNLYSVGALQDLKKSRKAPHALISYSSKNLGFSEERISKFALMDIDDEGFLRNIVEKPETDEVDGYRDRMGVLRVSMNIFNFSGEMIYPFLEDCPIDPVREEKELPQAVRNMVGQIPKSMWCIPRSEGIPDLTTADDIKNFNSYI